MFRVLLITGFLLYIAYRILPFLFKYFGGNKSRQNQQEHNNSSSSHQEDSKRFTKDVGEYVSYEEVKDDEK